MTPCLTLPNERSEEQARAEIARRDRASWFPGLHASGEPGIISGRDGREVTRCHKFEDRDQIIAMARSWDAMRDALEHARSAIASLPEDALGFGGGGPQQNTPDDPGDSVSWPLTAELLAEINSAHAHAHGTTPFKTANELASTPGGMK